ncbi:MAG: tol-pal system protein YbgF [Betaproteobacteria bacterium]|nr:tol-pal system protein YbgF [Betaproteobacteria bacterium]
MISRTSAVLAGISAAWLVLAAGPGAAALFGGDDVARKGVAEQQKRVDGLYSRYDEIAGRLSKLEDAIKAQASSASQPVLDLANQLQAMREELRTLHGQIEVVSNNIEANAKRQRDMYVDLDTRLRRFEQNAPAASAPGSTPAPGASAPAAQAAAQASSPASETQAYEAAQNQRRMGNYQGAIVAFQAFVSQYPKSSLAHRAQYWIGDSYYNLRDFKNAIANQQKVVSTYSDSASVPDALLNIASSHIELGDTVAARKDMDTLVSRYPTSEAAEKARRRLASLR